MADATSENWIWPLRADQLAPAQGGYVRIKKQIMAISDNTGEVAVHKIVLADLRKADGSAPRGLRVDRIYFDIRGYKSIAIDTDRAPRRRIATLSGGVGCWEGPVVDVGDPADGTGDLLLTSVPTAAGDTYDITIEAWLK